MKEIENKNIKLKLNSYVKDIKKENDKFLVYYNNDVLVCDELIISTGGKSYPKTGSDGLGYNLSKKLGHTINKTLPALVGLKCKEPFLKKLNGVRSNATVSLFINDKLIKSEIGEVQFTNYGLSGICIFNLSSISSRSISENKKVKISINFLDKLKIKNIKSFQEFIFSSEYNFKKEKVSYFLDNLLNYKLTNVILEKTKIERNKLVSKLSDNEINMLFENLFSFTMNIIDTNNFESAQITSGGVSLYEINPLTFESKIVSNLYLTGEVLDIDGDCGGYNISFAVLSGILAGESVKKND